MRAPGLSQMFSYGLIKPYGFVFRSEGGYSQYSLRGARTMKRKLLILSVLAICVAMLAGGTLAFFTSEDKAHNVITTGGVEITLQEWADEAKTTPFKDLTGVMPNTTVTKIAEIRNTGASDAWVRVKVEKNIRLQGDGTPDTGLVELKCNTVDWTEKDGYYYYNKILKPGEVTAPIFTAVSFAADMGDEYQDATATVDVFAQAVQTANNGDTVMTAQGWPNL